MTYLYLAIAIVAEVVATSALKASSEFTRVVPSLVVAIGYGVSFYFLARVLQILPIGVTYAIWSGVGIVLVALVGAVMYRQIPDAPAAIGMALIISGVGIIHLFSETVKH
ncbi:MAG: multidrug efflux SMR transporter [Halioglobus sp.]